MHDSGEIETRANSQAEPKTTSNGIGGYTSFYERSSLINEDIMEDSQTNLCNTS